MNIELEIAIPLTLAFVQTWWTYISTWTKQLHLFQLVHSGTTLVSLQEHSVVP